MSFIILLFTLMTTNAHSAWDINTICEGEDAGNILTSPLTQRSKDEWCMTAKCQLSDGASDSTLCVSHPNHYTEKNKFFTNALSVKLEHDVKGSQSNFHRGKVLMTHMLQKGGECFNECRPGVREKAINKDFTIYGLENPSCVSCVSKLPTENPAVVEVVGHNVKLYKGQKCFYECVISFGDYTDGDPYKLSCLKCIGAGLNFMDKKPEIDYLVTKDGKCLELSLGNYNKKHAIEVDKAVCEAQSKLFYTYYFQTPAWSFDTLVLKKPQECLEMDEKTKGDFYNLPVPMDKCVPNDPDCIHCR